jgi:hypothetical protein
MPFLAAANIQHIFIITTTFLSFFYTIFSKLFNIVFYGLDSRLVTHKKKAGTNGKLLMGGGL